MRPVTALGVCFALLVPAAFAQSPPPAPSAEAVEAGRLFDAGDYAAAAKSYAALVEANSTATPLRIRLAAALHNQGRYAEALAALDPVTKAGPNANALAWAARAQARLGKADEALASLEQAAKYGFIDLALLDSEPDLQPLRSQARFRELREAVEANAHPCAHDPEARRLDFWVGDWRVTMGGVLAGTSHVEKLLNECVVYENWTGSNGYVGKSFNVYDRKGQRWQQTWVDGLGRITEYHGEWKDGALRYLVQGIVPPGRKQPVDQRMTFFPLDDGRVRQLIEQSADGGQTWNVSFDGYYAKRD